jgi:hypothetical protein
MSRFVSSLLALLLALGAFAATQQFVVKELLNQRYANELVTYPFSAGKGACVADSLALSGPNGPQPVQLSDVELWPKTNCVKSGKVSFLVTALEPLATNTYTLSYGTKPVAAVKSDLAVMITATQAEILTSHLGARFPLGKAGFDPAKPAADAPGILTALRLEGGDWAGGSTPYGQKIALWSGSLVERGPVYARVSYMYILADRTTVTYAATVVAGDSAVRWKMWAENDRITDGLDLRLPAAPGLQQVTTLAGGGGWSKERTLKIGGPADVICKLSPRTSIAGAFPESPAAVVFKGDTELQLRARDAGAWVSDTPSFTYGGFKAWDLEMIPQMWNRWQRKGLPVSYGPAGVTLRVSSEEGERKWSTGSGAPRVGERLNEVKTMVLEWPQNARETHPHLFVSKAELQDAWARTQPDAARLNFLTAVKSYPGWANEGYLYSGGKPEIAAKAEVVKTLRDYLGKLGDYDMMRTGVSIVALYDGLIDTDLITPEEKRLFRAQLAAMGYALADPAFWSAERGYLSGNPNMSCSNICTLGILACEIPDHPMAKTWIAYVNGWMNAWLRFEVGENGEWLSEGMHYGEVSLTPLVAYAVAAQRIGAADFVNDPRLKKAVLYFAKYASPADPQRANQRVSPPIGRGLTGETSAVFGVMAKATAQSDPAFSKTMQWVWTQQGCPTQFGDWRMGGFEPIYLDKNLPAAAPAWTSENFPALGPIFRAGVATPGEHYLALRSYVDALHNLDVWAPEVGGLALWYAYGKPVSRAFTFEVGYNERHELLRDGVLLARNFDGTNGKNPYGYYVKTKPQAFSTLPRQDYAAAVYETTKADPRGWFPAKAPMPAWPKVPPAHEPTLAWLRQALFVKDDDPRGPHYLVLRDTTRGGQATQWQFWAASQLLDTPAAVAAAGANAKPAADILPARTLPPGDRYTALGQFGVDLDFFIASPANTPRSTLRYGAPDNNRVPEYQDLLHLQQPGDGSYYVAIVPRPHDAAAPAFSTLAGGKVIKVSGTFGSDYVFLAPQHDEASTDVVAFQGTCGSVQLRNGSVVLAVGAAGVARTKDFGLLCERPAALRASMSLIDLTLDGTAGQVKILAPDGYTLPDQQGVQLTMQDGFYTLTTAAGITSVRLVKK